MAEKVHAITPTPPPPLPLRRPNDTTRETRGTEGGIRYSGGECAACSVQRGRGKMLVMTLTAGFKSSKFPFTLSSAFSKPRHEKKA